MSVSNRDSQVLVAKQQVADALGDNYKTYLANMKLWFRKVWTKEQFDIECRKLFTPQQRHLHNQFFIAILNKITAPIYSKVNSSNGVVTNAVATTPKQPEAVKSISNNVISSSSGNNNINSSGANSNTNHSKKRRRTSGRSSERYIFESLDLYDFLPDQSQDYLTRLPSTPFLEMRYAAQELFLVDNALVMGRMLVSAWENGLVTADERICDYIVYASNVSVLCSYH